MRLAAPVCVVLCAPLLAACSNIGNLDLPKDYANIPTVQSIVDEITCELTSIALDQKEMTYFRNNDFVVAVELNLDVSDDGSLTPSFTYTDGLFSFGAAAKLDISREQNFSEQLFFSLKDLRDYAEDFGAKDGASPVCGNHVDTPLAGDLGLRQTAHMAITTRHINFDQKPSSPKAGAFGGFVKFVILKNVNGVGPTWTLKHFKGPGGLLGLSETNTDQMFFAFAKRTASGELPGTPPKKNGQPASGPASRPVVPSISRALHPIVRTEPSSQDDLRAQQFLQDLKINQLSNVLTQIQVNTR